MNKDIEFVSHKLKEGPALSDPERVRRVEGESKGFAAITTVLILASVVVSIAITVSMLSIGEAQSGLALFKGEDNLNFVEGCVEDYMLKIRADAGFAGGDISMPDGKICKITINSGNPNWDIIVTEKTTADQRNIRVVFVRGVSGITLTSWKEVN